MTSNDQNSPLSDKDDVPNASGIRGRAFDGALAVIPLTVLQGGQLEKSVEIVRAAVLYKDRIWSKPAPYRHSDIIN